MRQVDVALAYAAKGITVFPCKQDKSPATVNGFKDATTDAALIKRWWRKNPNFMIGSPNSNFTVLDIDDHNICVSGKTLTDNALYRLAEFLPSGYVTVTTMSGGRHFYFKKTSGVTRRIGALPNIDLLGDGGYVVLPDQKKYIANVLLWENVDTLPYFPKEDFDALSEDMRHASSLAKQLKKAFKEEQSGVKKEKKVAKNPSTKKTTSTKKKESFDATGVPEDLAALIDAEKNKPGINRETGEIHFIQTPDMYKKVDEFKADHSIIKKYKNGKLHIDSGELTSEKINALFHYPPIQEKLGKFLGLDVPKIVNEKTLMHSVLPGHADVRKSMGVRWSADGSHLIIRDFANHFADHYNQVDYNVVRLYATIRYKALAPRIKAPEFVVWFLRMLVDADILDVSHLKKKYAMPKADVGTWKVAEGLLLLDAVKQLYAGYDHTTTFSDRFCSAWCAVPPAHANRAKKMLHEGGYIHVEGICDCSGGARPDGFYNTKIFSIMDKQKIREINKLKASANGDAAKEQNEMKKEEKKEPKHVTLRGFSISEQSYQKIVNFCKDYKIENVPLRKNMFIETCTMEGLVSEEAPEGDGVYVIEGLDLEVIPKMKGAGNVLMVTGYCDELEEAFMDDVDAMDEAGHRILSEEPMIGFVISYDFDASKVDVAKITLKFRDYLDDSVEMDTFFVRYATSDEMFNDIYDGREPNMK